MYNHQLANLNGLTSLNGMPSTRSQSIHVCFSTYRYVLDVMLCTRLLLLWNYGGVILQELLDKSSLWSWSWSGPGSSLPHRHQALEQGKHALAQRITNDRFDIDNINIPLLYWWYIKQLRIDQYNSSRSFPIVCPGSSDPPGKMF